VNWIHALSLEKAKSKKQQGTTVFLVTPVFSHKYMFLIV
jgi:hypothetical protein